MSELAPEVLAAVGLAACRLAGVAAFAPAVAAAGVPVRVRMAVAFVLAVAALPAIAAQGVPAAAVAEPWRLVPAAAVEFALGAVIGVLAMLPVAAFRTAGALAGAQAGIGFGAMCAGDGAEDGADDPLAQLLACWGRRASCGPAGWTRWPWRRSAASSTWRSARGCPREAWSAR